MGAWKRALDLLIDPNIIALMLSLGLVGILVELWNPGLVLPGTVGVISLVVGLYGLQVLPVSAAGLLLMLVAAGLFVAEAFVASHGALALAGAVTFVIGALMLFDPAGEAYQVSLWTAVGIAATLALLLGFALSRVVKARRNPVEVGVDARRRRSCRPARRMGDRRRRALAAHARGRATRSCPASTSPSRRSRTASSSS